MSTTFLLLGCRDNAERYINQLKSGLFRMDVGLFNNVLDCLEEYFETNYRSWKIGKDFFTDEYGTYSRIVSYVCAQLIYLLRCVNEYGH